MGAAELLSEIASEGRSEFDENWKTRLAAELEDVAAALAARQGEPQ